MIQYQHQYTFSCHPSTLMNIFQFFFTPHCFHQQIENWNESTTKRIHTSIHKEIEKSKETSNSSTHNQEHKSKKWASFYSLIANKIKCDGKNRNWNRIFFSSSSFWHTMIFSIPFLSDWVCLCSLWILLPFEP